MRFEQHNEKVVGGSGETVHQGPLRFPTLIRKTAASVTLTRVSSAQRKAERIIRPWRDVNNAGLGGLQVGLLGRGAPPGAVNTAG